MLRGGGELAAVYAKEPDLLAAFVKRFPQAKVARSENEILEDRAIQLVLSCRRFPTSARRSASG